VRETAAQFNRLTSITGGKRMLDLKKLDFQYVTNQAGEKTGVLLPITEFQELLEDIEDLAAVVERQTEPTISHDEIIADLKQNGLI